MNSHRYGYLIFDKRAENLQWKKDSLFNNWHSACRRMRIDSFLSPCTKLKCKWIKDLHIKPGTLKLLEEKVGKTLEHIGIGENFLNRTPMACALHSRIDEWDIIRLQSFCKSNDTVKKTKWQPEDCEKIFTNPTSHRGLISNIYEEVRHQRIKQSYLRNGIQS